MLSINTLELLQSFRALCPALDSFPDDRILGMMGAIPSLHPELSPENYGQSLNEAIVMMCAHRLASDQMFALGSQVAIAQGKPFMPHTEDWLLSTPYGQRVHDLRIQSPSLGAMSIGDSYHRMSETRLLQDWYYGY